MSNCIGFIGAGNMAGAIISGILRKGIAVKEEIAVYDKMENKRKTYESLGLNVMNSIAETAAFSEILFLAVKPQNYEEVLEELKETLRSGQIIVSIAAGISTGYIKDKLGHDCKVVRVMPNTPLLLGEGAAAMCLREPVTREDFERVKAIFEAGGIVEELPEELMNAVIAVNGSSPAYIYLFAKAVIEGAVAQGIEADAAKALICKTLSGSAEMLMNSGKSPDELIRDVSSPGGTTLKALEALYEHDFTGSILDAMRRCTQRAEELGK